MFKKLFLLLLALILSSCSLALDEYSSWQGNQFIGFYITKKPIESNSKVIFQTNSEMIEVDGQLTDQVLLVDLESVNGYLMITTIGNGSNLTGTQVISSELTILPQPYNTEQPFNFITYLNFTNDIDFRSLYLNPVYQNSNNEIFSLPTPEINNIEMVLKDNDELHSGGYRSGIIEALHDENGNKLTSDRIYTFNYRGIDEIETSIISEYNNENELIQQHVNAQEIKLFEPKPETEYFVLKQVLDSEQYSIYQRTDEFNYISMTSNQEGILIEKFIEINW